MPELDKETLEYFRSNLERDVRESVERKLFRTWTALATAFLAGVGLVGAPWLMGYLDRQIAEAVHDRVGKAVNEPTEKARKQAEEAETVARTSLSELQVRKRVLDESLEDMRRKSAEADTDMAKLRRDVASGVREINDALKASQERLGEIDDRARQLSDRLRNAVPDAAVLASLTEDVKALVGEVARLGGELKRVADKAGAPVAADLDKVQQQQMASLQQTAVQRTQQVAQMPTSGLTVYLQFAGFDRDTVKGLSKRLAAAGFHVPGEERIGAAQGLREIRCFYVADCEQAARLKEVIDGYLRTVEKEPVRTVTVKSLPDYTPKPRPGIVEVWVGL
ncbi:MAG: hypothetical protein U1E23_01665 [Reyranellaceae bacterium]